MDHKLLENKYLMDIIEHLYAAMYIVDKEGKMVYFNKAAKDLDKLEEKDIGRSLADIYCNTVFQKSLNSPCLDTLATGTPHIQENLEWFLEDGTNINAITSTYPMMEDGKIIGTFALSEDIDKLREILIRQGFFKRKISYRLRNKAMKNGTQYVFNDIIGSSEIMKNTIITARRFAAKKLPVMIYGETGTGKEMFAQSIHNASPHVKGPFIAINCAAIPENLLESMLFGTVKGAFTGAVDSQGLFEKAENGSVFLDEVNSMPIILQAKLLRALQEKEVQRIGDSKVRKLNCRIISATNKRPSDAIRDKEIREDLYYRLSTGMVYLPSLKDRESDIDEIIEFFLEKANEELDTSILALSKELNTLLHSYCWPGNVRELSNIMESAMNMTADGETILDVQHLPTYLKQHFSEELIQMPNASEVFSLRNEDSYNNVPMVHFYSDINTMVDTYEQELLEFALLGTKGNLTKCSVKLGISRQSLSVKLKKYNIDPKVYKIK